MSISPSDFNASIIAEFRANSGHVGGPFENSPLLLLHYADANSGKARVTPLGYITDKQRYVVVASNGGSPINPAWYHSLMANPKITVEVGCDMVKAVASEAVGMDRERLFRAMAARAKQVVEYQAKVDRRIPVIVLTPIATRS